MLVREILFLSVVILICICILTILFVYLAVHKLIEKYQTREVEHYMKEKSDLIYEYIIEGRELSRDIIPDTKSKRKALEETLSRYSRNISGENVLSRITEYAESYLSDYYRKSLQSRKWSMRMNVLYRIADFRMSALMDDVLSMLRSSNKYSREEYIQMYRVLAVLQYKDFSECLLHSKIALSEFEYRKLLVQLNQEQLKTMIDQYDQLPLTLKYNVIEMVGLKNFIELVPFLEERIHDKTSEIRIRVLKALSQIGFIRNPEIYFPFVRSDIWEERMMVARLLAHSNSANALTYLRVLLKDSSWWVRSQAAQSFTHLKNGKKILETVIEADDDRFAQDMAKEVLGKG